MATVISWAERSLGVRVGTYPPKDMPTDFAVVQRVGGTMRYPHDAPRYSVQLWTDDDESGEQVIMALARLLPNLASEDERINAVDLDAEVTQLGRIETGHYIWQLTFQLYVNIKD